MVIRTNAIRTKVILPVPREILKSKDERVIKKSIQNFKFLKVFSIRIVIFKIGFMAKTTITRHLQTLVYTMNTLLGHYEALHENLSLKDIPGVFLNINQGEGKLCKYPNAEGLNLKVYCSIILYIFLLNS